MIQTRLDLDAGDGPAPPRLDAIEAQQLFVGWLADLAAGRRIDAGRRRRDLLRLGLAVAPAASGRLDVERATRAFAALTRALAAGDFGARPRAALRDLAAAGVRAQWCPRNNAPGEGGGS